MDKQKLRSAVREASTGKSPEARWRSQLGDLAFGWARQMVHYLRVAPKRRLGALFAAAVLSLGAVALSPAQRPAARGAQTFGGYHGTSPATGDWHIGNGGTSAQEMPLHAGGDQAPVLCDSDEEKRVLFIGNSYTHYFEMPRLIEAMARSAECNLHVEYVAPGGSRLKLHAQSGETLSAIGSQDWDAVVLQNFSQLPSQPLPEVERKTMPHVMTLVNAIRDNDPETQLFYYVTWGRRDGDKKYCKQYPEVCTFDGHTEALHRGYSFYASQTGGTLVDVGGAWARVKRDPRRAFSYRTLYDPDGSHPSLKGSYLAAAVFFTALYRRSPVGLSYPQGLSQGAARYLQKVAAATPISGA